MNSNTPDTRFDNLSSRSRALGLFGSLTTPTVSRIDPIVQESIRARFTVRLMKTCFSRRSRNDQYIILTTDVSGPVSRFSTWRMENASIIHYVKSKFNQTTYCIRTNPHGLIKACDFLNLQYKCLLYNTERYKNTTKDLKNPFYKYSTIFLHYYSRYDHILYISTVSKESLRGKFYRYFLSHCYTNRFFSSRVLK